MEAYIKKRNFRNKIKQQPGTSTTKSPWQKIKTLCFLVGFVIMLSACGEKYEDIMEQVVAIEEGFNEHNAKKMQESINKLKNTASTLEAKSKKYGSSEKENQEANYGQYLIELMDAYVKLFEAEDCLNRVSADYNSGKMSLDIDQLEKAKLPHHQISGIRDLSQADGDIENAIGCINKYKTLIENKELDSRFEEIVREAVINAQNTEDRLQTCIYQVSVETGYSIREIRGYMGSLASTEEDKELETGQTEENSKNTKGTNKVVDWALHGYLGMNRDE